MLWILILAGLAWLAGVVLLWHVPRCRINPGRTWQPRVSVIIPARNEEQNLRILLPSLVQQDPRPEEIIVVDDHSQDRTAEVARGGGAAVLASQPLPAGWLGKPWACQQGAEQATGEVLVFLDADTVLEPGGLQRMIDTLKQPNAALSLSPYHRPVTWQEQFSAYFNILQIAGVNAFTVLADRVKPAGLFGPCLALGRETYFRIGGHAAVKDKILENYSLARPLAEQGVSVRLCGGFGAVNVRLYPGGIADLIRGWGKSFAMGAGQTPGIIMLLIIAWISGQVIGTAFFAQALILWTWPDFILWGTVYALFAGQVAWHLGRTGAFKWHTSAFFPIFLVFFLGIFSWSALVWRKRGMTWKGRDISQGS
ncbi:MAG: glycosyltransferase family 2 protein [candidate division FCPU426 bacterium]